MITYKCTARHETLYDPAARETHSGTICTEDTDPPTVCQHLVAEGNQTMRLCGKVLTELTDEGDA